MIGLAVSQRDVLIEHLDGWSPIVRAADMEHAARNRERVRLVQAGMLRYDQQIRPRATIITEKGRAALAAALADWADALIRAGADGVNLPLAFPEVDSRPAQPENLPSWPFDLTPSPAAAGPTAAPSAPTTDL